MYLRTLHGFISVCDVSHFTTTYVSPQRYPSGFTVAFQVKGHKFEFRYAPISFRIHEYGLQGIYRFLGEEIYREEPTITEYFFKRASADTELCMNYTKMKRIV